MVELPLWPWDQPLNHEEQDRFLGNDIAELPRKRTRFDAQNNNSLIQLPSESPPVLEWESSVYTCMDVGSLVEEQFDLGVGENDLEGSIHQEKQATHASQPVTNANDVDGLDQEIICCGTLSTAYAELGDLPKWKAISKDHRRYQTLEVSKGEETWFLRATSVDAMAIIDNDTCNALRTIHDSPGVKFAGVVETLSLRKLPPKGTKYILSLSINIFTAKSSAKAVGNRLSNASAFLQHPFFLETGFRYFNPQCFQPGGKMRCMTHLVGLDESEYRSKQLSDEIGGILESLDSVSSSEMEIAQSHRLRAITIPLKSHQVAAVAFILGREDTNKCQMVQKRLRGLCRVSPEHDIPSYSTGGILADVMGLGKTLTMISAVVASLDEASTFATAVCEEYLQMGLSQGYKSQATLVVVTSIQLIDVWKRELSIRVAPGWIKTCVFHSDNRPTLPEQVTGHNIVLTTYATLVADKKRLGVLQGVEWYRVVLDEAHWIRNKSSCQFRAAESLKSERRWCLSGTPIQNWLNDLESLLGFLHFQPFSRTPVFQKYIIEPLTRETPDRAKNLKALLSGLCLRRGEKYLGLPDPIIEEIRVKLTAAERTLYDDIIKRCARDIDDVVSKKTNNKKYAVLFAAITKLRRMCNHGTTSISTTGTSRLAPSATDILEADCEYCSGINGENIALLDTGSICDKCGKVAGVDEIQQPGWRSPTDEFAAGTLPPWQGVHEVPYMIPQTLPATMSNPVEYSSKLLAVVKNVEASPAGSRSLVFSYWTSTLDMLEGLLKSRSIRCLRIDGRVPYADRLRVLADMEEDPNAKVLLMSIGTGSVGLNLTVANYVHIVEPQWNPSVEEQAIARALRIGQTRPVTVVRYIVTKSVEENILSLQQKKKNLAKFTLDAGPDDNQVDKLDDLRFILDFHGADNGA